MSPASTTVVDPDGYLYQLPSLGLPQPLGQWTRVCGAIGPKDESISLVENCKATDAPLRHAEGKYGIFELEYEGAIWFFPTALPSHSASRPELFSVEIQRLPASTAPAGNRTQLPKGTRWIYMNHRAQEMQYGVFERSEDELRKLHEELGGQFSMEVLRHYRRCVNPTSAEAEPVVPPIESNVPTAAAKRKAANTEELSKAWMLWLALGKECLNEDWLKQLHRDAIAAGLRKSTTKFEDGKPLVRFRPSREPDWDVRGVDYALMGEDGKPEALLADWLPMPDYAAAPEWIRLGANLMRFEVGRRLIMKEEWPPRPTTLMMLKGGRQS